MQNVIRILSICIGLVWLINGLVCKVLGLVPRHEQIVARIIGGDYSHGITVAIGLGEIFLAIWFWTGILSRFNAILQIVLVAAMNVLEFFIAPDLLLWGPFNAFYASVFIGIVYLYEFQLKKIGGRFVPK